MILKHDEAEPLELSSGPYGDVEMESLNGRWISQSAMAPAKGEKRRKGEGGRRGASETLFLFAPSSCTTPEAVCVIRRLGCPGTLPCSFARPSSQRLTG